MGSKKHQRTLRPQTVSALYRLGLELGPQESATLQIVAGDNSHVAVVVTPSGGGLVEVRCSDELVRAHLSSFVGIKVVDSQ